MTKPVIESRTFWTYTKCYNQLSYLALEFNQFILYWCNCPIEFNSANESTSSNHFFLELVMVVKHCEEGFESLHSRPGLVIGGISTNNRLKVQKNDNLVCWTSAVFLHTVFTLLNSFYWEQCRWLRGICLWLPVDQEISEKKNV